MQSKETAVIACEGDLVEAYGKSLAEMDMFDLWLADDPDGNKAELLVAALQELGAKDISTRPGAPSKEHWDRMIENGRKALADVPDASAWVDDIRGDPVE